MSAFHFSLLYVVVYHRVGLDIGIPADLKSRPYYGNAPVIYLAEFLRARADAGSFSDNAVLSDDGVPHLGALLDPGAGEKKTERDLGSFFYIRSTEQNGALD